VDGVVVPSTLVGMERAVDPGTRNVVGKSRATVVNQEVALAEGERKELVLKFGSGVASTPPAASVAAPNQPTFSGRQESSPPPERGSSAGKTQRTVGWVSLGVGAAGLAVGTATGILVAVKYGSLSNDCPNRQCGPEHWSASNSYATMRTVSTVGFVVGAVGVAAGVTLLLTSPKERPTGNLALYVAPASAGLQGSY
jgi:hypothetical protein